MILGDIGSDIISSPAGALAALAAVLTAFLRGWIVPRDVYRQCCKERDEWREIALDGLRLSHKAVSVTSEVATAAAEVEGHRRLP